MQKTVLLTSALALSLCGALTACGGGGGSSPTQAVAVVPPPPPPPPVSSAPTISSAPQATVMESSADAFYTLEASDPDGDPVTLVLVDSDDAQAFSFNSTTGELSPLEMLDYEQPLDDNEDNIYNLSFEVSDNTGVTTQFSVEVSVGDIRDAFQFGLDPNVVPAENFELIDWRLDFPLNEDGELTGQQDAPSERELVGLSSINPALGSTSAPGEGFEHPLYFRTGADGGLVMRAPVIGATTSSGVRFTRTEFREMLRRGNTSISTNTNSTTERPNLNNWAFSSQPQDAQDEAGGVDGTLRVTMSVNNVTTTGRDNEVGRLIIGQIHARNDEPARLYYRKLPGNTHGSIYVCHEIRDGDDITFNILGSIDDDQPNPEDGFLLGEIFTYEITARGNFIDVVIIQDDVVVGEVTIDQSNSGYDIAADYMYFKAGNYHVNSTADPDEFAEVTLYELENTHEGYDF
ncbi:MAG: polysaccharide lyase family 7 protein [Maricaulaceae bacterium]